MLFRSVSQSRYDFLVPQVKTPVGGWPIGSLGDYFGLPTVGQVGAGKEVSHSVLPLRAFNLIFNEWFRDQNLVQSFPVNTGDAGANGYHNLLRRGKRHDYFTSALPWPQKGPGVELPLVGNAPVKSNGAVAGFDLLYSLQDIEVDKKLGLHSIPSKFGVEKTMKISKVFHALTVLFWFLFVVVSNSSYFAYVAVIVSALMLSYEHYLVNKDFRKIDKAFFTVNGYLGIIFFILIILDKIFF